MRHNLGLKLLSLMTAFVIWGTVQTQTDPLVTRRKTLKVVPIGVPKDLAPVSVEPPEVTLTLSGRVSAFDRLAMHNPRLTANVAKADVGTYNAMLQPDDLPAGLQVRELPRSTAVVELDNLTSATKPLYVELRGRPAQGFAVSSWQVRPNEVTVEGPSSLLLRVDRIVAEVDVSGRSTTLTAAVAVGVRDAANVLLSGVTPDPGEATVTVLLRQVNSKTVPVVPVLTGSPAGLEISSVVVNPSVVTLEGPAGTLGAVDSVQTSPLDVRNVSGRATLSGALRVPAGCNVLGASSVRVTISARPSRGYTAPLTRPAGTPPETSAADRGDAAAQPSRPSGEGPAATGPSQPSGSAGAPPEGSRDDQGRGKGPATRAPRGGAGESGESP
jgi:YbbR domain-containing protein